MSIFELLGEYVTYLFKIDHTGESIYFLQNPDSGPCTTEEIGKLITPKDPNKKPKSKATKTSPEEESPSQKTPKTETTPKAEQESKNSPGEKKAAKTGPKVKKATKTTPNKGADVTKPSPKADKTTKVEEKKPKANPLAKFLVKMKPGDIPMKSKVRRFSHFYLHLIANKKNFPFQPK